MVLGRRFLQVACLSALSLPGLAAGPEEVPGLDELLRRHQVASGAARLRAFQVVRLEGRVDFQGRSVPFVKLKARPDRCRVELRLGDRLQVWVCEGGRGWLLGADGTRRPLRFEEVAGLDPDFDGPLLDAELKGHRLTYQGVQTFEGMQAHVVGAHLADGRVQRHYLAIPSYRRIGAVTETPVGEVKLVFSEDQKVDGVVLPFLVQGPDGTLRVERAEFPERIGEATFRLPDR